MQMSERLSCLGGRAGQGAGRSAAGARGWQQDREPGEGNGISAECELPSLCARPVPAPGSVS